MPFFSIDRTKPDAQSMLNVLRNGRDSRTQLGSIVAAMTAMLGGGDPTIAASYSMIVTRYGFASNADAMNAYNALSQVYAILMTDGLTGPGNTTVNLKTTMDTLPAMFGVI